MTGKNFIVIMFFIFGGLQFVKAETFSCEQHLEVYANDDGFLHRVRTRNRRARYIKSIKIKIENLSNSNFSGDRGNIRGNDRKLKGLLDHTFKRYFPNKSSYTSREERVYYRYLVKEGKVVVQDMIKDGEVCKTNKSGNFSGFISVPEFKKLFASSFNTDERNLYTMAFEEETSVDPPVWASNLNSCHTAYLQNRINSKSTQEHIARAIGLGAILYSPFALFSPHFSISLVPFLLAGSFGVYKFENGQSRAYRDLVDQERIVTEVTSSDPQEANTYIVRQRDMDLLINKILNKRYGMEYEFNSNWLLRGGPLNSLMGMITNETRKNPMRRFVMRDTPQFKEAKEEVVLFMQEALNKGFDMDYDPDLEENREIREGHFCQGSTGNERILSKREIKDIIYKASYVLGDNDFDFGNTGPIEDVRIESIPETPSCETNAAVENCNCDGDRTIIDGVCSTDSTDVNEIPEPRICEAGENQGIDQCRCEGTIDEEGTCEAPVVDILDS